MNTKKSRLFENNIRKLLKKHYFSKTSQTDMYSVKYLTYVKNAVYLSCFHDGSKTETSTDKIKLNL